MIKTIDHLPYRSGERPARLTWAELAFRGLALFGAGFIAGLIAFVVQMRFSR